MICKIAGKLVATELVYFREHKYGTEAPGYDILPYRLVVTHEEFLAAFEEYYDDYAEDDKKFGMEAENIDLQLRELQWPLLRSLITEFPRLCESFLMTATSYSVIQELFANRQIRPRLYLINSVSSVTVGEDSIEFRGEAIYIPPKSPSTAS